MKVTNSVYALDSTKGNYAYLILSPEIILIDTGRPGQGHSILSELESMGIKPEKVKHILLTHHDIDHIGNASFLQQATKARIWASAEDLPYIYGDRKRPGIKKIISALIKIEKPQNIEIYEKDQEIGGCQIIPTPGHTPGHVCLLYEDVLFAGDLVMSNFGKLKRSLAIMTWDRLALNDSIKKIAPLSFKWICPAHGVPIVRGNQWEILL